MQFICEVVTGTYDKKLNAVMLPSGLHEQVADIVSAFLAGDEEEMTQAVNCTLTPDEIQETDNVEVWTHILGKSTLWMGRHGNEFSMKLMRREGSFHVNMVD